MKEPFWKKIDATGIIFWSLRVPFAGFLLDQEVFALLSTFGILLFLT